MDLDLSNTYVLLRATGGATPMEGGPAFWERPEQELDALGGDWLVSEFSCNTSCPQWEMHPEGDELVCLLSGEVDLVLELPGAEQVVRLSDRGGVIVPRGVWHTARVIRPSRMLFVTRGRGTQHRATEV